MSDLPPEVVRARVMALIERELEGTLDDASRRWLDQHRDDFPELGAALAALEGGGPIWQDLDGVAESPTPPELRVKEQVKAHLAGEPVEALPLEARPRFGVISLTGVAVGLLLATLGLRTDFAGQPWYQVVVPAVCLIGGFVVAMLAFDHLRQRGWLGLSAGVMVAAPCLFVAVALSMREAPHSHAATTFLGPALGCGSVGMVVGLIVLVPAIVLARRGMAGPSQLGALLLGITAASVGVGALHLRCSMVDLSHVLVGHGLLFLMIPLAALVLRSVRRLA